MKIFEIFRFDDFFSQKNLIIDFLEKSGIFNLENNILCIHYLDGNNIPIFCKKEISINDIFNISPSNFIVFLQENIIYNFCLNSLYVFFSENDEISRKYLKIIENYDVNFDVSKELIETGNFDFIFEIIQNNYI